MTYLHLSTFFALHGFLTLLLIRHIAPYKRVLTQTEFVFYSLACSVPSYLTAALLVGMLDIAAASPSASAPVLVVLVQGAAAALYGVAVGLVAKVTWRRLVNRYTPWYGFMLNARGRYVIVHTTSSERYYGWVKQVSGDDEPRREIDAALAPLPLPAAPDGRIYMPARARRADGQVAQDTAGKARRVALCRRASSRQGQADHTDGR